MLTRLADHLWKWQSNICPWTNVVGLVRSLLAISTLLTLLFNDAETLFRPASGALEVPACFGPARFSIFCLVPRDYHALNMVRVACIIVLAIVASGWRPMITGFFHWWISFSVNASAITVDGGDQVNAVLTMILLPITITDRRPWHWLPANEVATDAGVVYRKMVAIPALWAARLQVAGIYLHAAVGKFFVPEWVDGTAVYYWFTDPLIGLSPWLLELMWPLLISKWVVLLTWGTLVLELILFLGLALPRQYRKFILVSGVVFHALIAVFFGIISFAISMVAALLIYTRPVEEELRFQVPARLPGKISRTIRVAEERLHA